MVASPNLAKEIEEAAAEQRQFELAKSLLIEHLEPALQPLIETGQIKWADVIMLNLVVELRWLREGLLDA